MILKLLDYGIQSGEASSLISDLAKKFRRLERDIRHKGEEARLRLRHQLEEELGEELPAVPENFILDVVDRIVPSGRLTIGVTETSPTVGNVSITNIAQQQIVHRAEGIVAQEFNGTAVLGEGARAIENLIITYAKKNEIDELNRALREVDDEDAPSMERVRGKGLLRSFLASVADKATGAAVSLGQKYLENQMGMS